MEMMEILNEQHENFDLKEKIKGLESKNRHLLNENNSLKVSLNYLLNNLKHFIDTNNQKFPDLTQIYNEAKTLEEEFDEENNESENTRRENRYEDYKAKLNEFSRVSLDSYENSNNGFLTLLY